MFAFLVSLRTLCNYFTFSSLSQKSLFNYKIICSQFLCSYQNNQQYKSMSLCVCLRSLLYSLEIISECSSISAILFLSEKHKLQSGILLIDCRLEAQKFFIPIDFRQESYSIRSTMFWLFILITVTIIIKIDHRKWAVLIPSLNPFLSLPVDNKRKLTKLGRAECQLSFQWNKQNKQLMNKGMPDINLCIPVLSVFLDLIRYLLATNVIIAYVTNASSLIRRKVNMEQNAHFANPPKVCFETMRERHIATLMQQERMGSCRLRRERSWMSNNS